MQVVTHNIDIPRALQWLLDRGIYRYKVLYGGRGGAKSHTIARCLLVLATQIKHRILCTRETQKSIAESVHHLLAGLIGELGLPGWTVEKARIYHTNGSEFVFAGLRHNEAGLKSIEAIDIVWVEEAQVVSKSSWDSLIPTIRKANSEIWVSFNPELAEDATWQLFCAGNPPPGTRVQKINYTENPWCPAVLRREADHCRQTDPKAYAWIWAGECRPAVEGAIYEKEMARATNENRITTVVVEPSLPVDTSWDLGFGDATAVWFSQRVGGTVRLLGYREYTGTTVTAIIREMQALASERGWIWGKDYLPWDGGRKDPDGRSIEERLKQLGRAPVVASQARVADGVDAVRTVFHTFWFDAAQCEDGLQALRHYQYGVNANTDSTTREPLHNWASHGADALRSLIMGVQTPKPKTMPKRVYVPSYGGGGGWMA